MSSGSGSGVGGVVGTVAGMAALYWLAIALAVTFLTAALAAVLSGLLVIAAIYGAGKLIARSARATVEGDWRWLGTVYVPPLMSLLGWRSG